MPVLCIKEEFLNVAKVMLQSCPRCSNHVQEQFLNSPRADSGKEGGLAFHVQYAADSTLEKVPTSY